MNCRSLTLIAALAAFAAPARAQDAAGMMGGGCMMQQLTQLCPDAKPGTPDFSACAKLRSGDAMAACSKQSSAAGAAETSKTAAGASPCADDVKKYCPGKWPGTPEFSACMHSHMGDVTPACAAWAKKRENMKRGDLKSKGGGDVCVDDARKLCAGLTVLDGARFTDCMTKNYAGLSLACQKKFKDLKEAKTGAHAECMAALQELCPDMQPGDNGAMMQCMMAHQSELPPSHCHKH